MDPNLLQSADPMAAALFFGTMAATVIGAAAKLFAGSRWDDWLDERCGRGSVRGGCSGESRRTSVTSSSLTK